MFQESTIIRTKLQPPRVSDIIHREKSGLFLSQLHSKKLITVTAGAGYGKTTLVADALHKLDQDTVWFRLDKTDTDFAAFLQYLCAGVKNVYSDFGDEILGVLLDPGGVNRDQMYLLTLFVNDLERVCSRDLFFVLDDFHLIQDTPEIKNAIAFMVQHLPCCIHLILISRTAINLPLSRMKVMQAVMTIDEADLRFNTFEIQKLFREIFDLSITENHTRILFEKTRGWISGLVLFYHMLNGKTEIEIDLFLKNIKGSRGEIYTYLEENVFGQLKPEDQFFLIKTSILSRLHPDFCDPFLDIKNSGEILKHLKESHLFTFSLDGEKEGYIYHDLFKDFLREKRKRQIHKNEIQRLHEKAAGLYEKNNDYMAALDHYLESNRMEDVSRLAGLYARLWIKQGRIRKIQSFLEKMPGHYQKQDPWCLFLEAGLMDLAGRVHDSLEGYGKALEAFRKKSFDWGLNQCLAEMAISYCNMGDFEKAEPLFLELLSKIKSSSTLRTLCLGYLISLSSSLGKMSDADQYTEASMSALGNLSDKIDKQAICGWIYVNVGRRYVIEGRFQEAIEILEKALNTLKNTGQYRVIAFCYLILLEVLLKQFEHKKSMDTAKKLITLVKEKGFKDGLLPGGHILYAHCCLRMGRLEEAEQSAKKGLAGMKEIGDLSGQAKAHTLLYYIHFISGNLKGAEKYVRQGIEIIQPVYLPRIQAELEVCLASLLTEKGQTSEALELLQNAEEKSRTFGWERAMVSLEYARCYQTMGRMDQALNILLNGLSVCEENGYDLLLIIQKTWIVPLLVAIFSSGEKKDYIRNNLIKMGPEVIDSLSSIIEGNPQPLIKNTAADLLNELRYEFAAGLKIHFFGKFRLFMGEMELPVDAWKSKKALQLFKYLIFSRGRGYIHKEVLMELLWPDEDPKKSSNSFHVALNAMRKILEPNLSKSIPSAYILSNKGTYLLDIGKNGSVDTEVFLEEIKQARNSNDPETSMNHFLKAISLYTGDFLEEDIYVDWCGDVREGLKEDYLFAIKAVIKFYEKQKAYDKCIEFASTYLKTDKYAEEIYQLLMRCYSHFGDNAMGIKTFEKCRQHIMFDLNCPLSRETIELYQQLNPN